MGLDMRIEGLNIKLSKAGVYILREDGGMWTSAEEMFMNGAKGNRLYTIKHRDGALEASLKEYLVKFSQHSSCIGFSTPAVEAMSAGESGFRLSQLDTLEECNMLEIQFLMGYLIFPSTAHQACHSANSLSASTLSIKHQVSKVIRNLAPHTPFNGANNLQKQDTPNNATNKESISNNPSR